MRIGASVDDNAGRMVAGLLYPVDKVAFMIGLPEIDGEPEFGPGGHAVLFDLSQGLAAIDAGFAPAERVEVWTVEDEDCFQMPTFQRRATRRDGTSIIGIIRCGKSASGFFCCPQAGGSISKQ